MRVVSNWYDNVSVFWLRWWTWRERERGGGRDGERGDVMESNVLEMGRGMRNTRYALFYGGIGILLHLHLHPFLPPFFLLSFLSFRFGGLVVVLIRLLRPKVSHVH